MARQNLHFRSRNFFKKCGIGFASSDDELTWRHIVIFALALYALRYAAILAYCFLCHKLYYGWTECPTEQYVPQNFSDVSPSALKIVDEPASCAETHRVVVYVHSAFSQFSRRAVIRNTWARPMLQRDDIKFVFVIGSPPSYDAGVEQELGQEIAQFNDVLRLGFVEHYYNLTLKTRAFYNWTQFRCKQARHVVRADTDVVLHTDALLRFLRHIHPTGHYIYGYCRPHDCVTRLSWSRTCLPQTFYKASGRAIFFPRYCFGFSYVATMDFVREAVLRWRNSTATSSNVFQAYMPSEDLHTIGFTGSLTKAWRINQKQRFTLARKFDAYSCRNSVVASAAYDDDSEMERRWRAYVARCSQLSY